MIPWLIFALVLVPLLLFVFVAARRRTVAYERPAKQDAEARARMEEEFAEADAYEAEWRKEDKARYDEERFP